MPIFKVANNVDESDMPTFEISCDMIIGEPRSDTRSDDMTIGEVTDDDDGNSLSLSSLDDCTPQDEQHSKARVSFRDEELGLSPRHLVTKIYHRPHTTKEEKSLLWYSPQDLKKFRLVEQIHVLFLLGGKTHCALNCNA